jgi:hypothetical protein
MITISSAVLASSTKRRPSLRGVSMDVFVRNKGMKKLEGHREFEIYYLMKK